MGSPVTTIQPSYVSLLSDISSNQPAGQTTAAPLGFFSQCMDEAIADAAASSQIVSTIAEATTPSAPVATPAAPAVSQATSPAAPKTIQVQIDATPGALYGRPIAPEGAVETGQWAILPDGSYFSASDVNSSGLATLHAPPAGWQSSATGQTLDKLLGVLA